MPGRTQASRKRLLQHDTCELPVGRPCIRPRPLAQPGSGKSTRLAVNSCIRATKNLCTSTRCGIEIRIRILWPKERRQESLLGPLVLKVSPRGLQGDNHKLRNWCRKGRYATYDKPALIGQPQVPNTIDASVSDVETSTAAVCQVPHFCFRLLSPSMTINCCLLRTELTPIAP